MGNRPNYYSVTPATVRYDKNIPANAKLLYGEITALCNEKGYCWASNNYFASLYNVSPQAVSRWINILAKAGYIRIEYERAGKQITQRNIFLGVSTDIEGYQQIVKGVSINCSGGINKKLRGYQQIVKENTTLNTTSNNTPEYIEPKPKKKKYGEHNNVLFTEAEYNKLLEEWGEKELARMLGIFSEGLAMKKYVYKSHYLAIKNWRRNEKERDAPKHRIKQDEVEDYEQYFRDA